MKHVDEYRDGQTAQKLAATIAREVQEGRSYRLMEFCGGHTHAIFRYGVQDLLPDNIEMVHGPGCPVCVLPISRIDQAIAYAQRPDVILCSYGDMLRVPGSKFTSLMKAKAEGADVRMVYSTLDALELAKNNPDKKIVFFAIGFETTTPPTALAIKQAKAMGLRNFFILSNHVLTPSAIQNILESPDVRDLGSVPIDGFLGPAHVSAVIGSQPYDYFVEEFQRPVVISGFEPLDVMQSILMLVRQLNEGRAEVENQYRRAVTFDGNAKAKNLVAEIFELRRTFEWRGLGEVAYSGLRIKQEYSAFDAEVQIPIDVPPARENKACECPAILRGMKKPTDCKLFATHCTPENPMGSCMVSAEGACAAYYSYGRFRETA